MTQPEVTESPEEELSAIVYAMITAWLAAVGPAVLATAVFGGLPDLTAMWRFQQLWVQMVDDRLMPFLARLARDGWLLGNRDLGRSRPFNPNDPYLTDVLARTRNLLVRIPDDVYQQIIRSLATGRDAGETRDQLIARINNVLTITGSENWKHRADVIARTELNRFTNAGMLARGLAETTVQVAKQWISKDDARVRNSHADADGQIRRIGEPFQVGFSLMQQPQDPLAAAFEVVNCRCRMKLLEVSRGA